jgi:hypothetical protein
MINSIGNIASIIGVFISLYLIYALRKIHKHFLFKARFPELKRSLSDKSSKLSDLLQDFDNNKPDIKHNLRLIETILKNCEKKVDGEYKKSVSTLKIEIGKFNNSNSKINKMFNYYIPITHDNVWEVYSKLQALIEDLNQKLKDSKWEDQ